MGRPSCLICKETISVFTEYYNLSEGDVCDDCWEKTLWKMMKEYLNDVKSTLSERKINEHTNISMNAYDKGIIQGKLEILRRLHKDYHNHYSCGMKYEDCKNSKEGHASWRFRCKFQGEIIELEEQCQEDTKEVTKNV